MEYQYQKKSEAPDLLSELITSLRQKKKEEFILPPVTSPTRSFQPRRQAKSGIKFAKPQLPSHRIVREKSGGETERRIKSVLEFDDEEFFSLAYDDEQSRINTDSRVQRVGPLLKPSCPLYIRPVHVRDASRRMKNQELVDKKPVQKRRKSTEELFKGDEGFMSINTNPGLSKKEELACIKKSLHELLKGKDEKNRISEARKIGHENTLEKFLLISNRMLGI